MLPTSLPRQYFTSSDIYNRETIRVFSRSWICAGHIAEFPPAPSYKQFEIGPYSIIVARPDSETLHAFHNVCRHRGTRLCDQSQGKIPNGVFVCPYHAWTYNLQGHLIGAPNMSAADDFRREDYPLAPVTVQNWNGLVMLHLASSVPDISTVLQPLAKRLANWSVSELGLAATLSYEVRANWKLLFQNYSECYHCPSVHPALNRLTPYRTATNDLTCGPILGGPMDLEEGFETVSSDGRLVARPCPGLISQQRRQVYYYTVFPTLFVSAHPDYIMVHVLSRRDVDMTHVACHFLVVPSSEHEAAEKLSKATIFWDEVNRQDWRVCELTQRGAASPAFVPGPYSRLESMVLAFDRHYLNVLQKA